MTQHAPVPPQNLEAEENVLGAIMLSPHALPAVSEIVRPEDFYRDSHGEILRAALALDHKGEPVDAITLVNELQERGTLADVGGRSRVHELASLVPTWSNAPHYATIVRETATLRGLVAVGGQISRMGYERPGPTEELVAKAEHLVAAVADHTAGGEATPLDDSMGEILAKLTTAVETQTPIFGQRTGFPDLDKALTGFHPGQLVVIAARPGVGKSLLMQNITENVADFGVPGAIFSLEMAKSEIGLRSIARKTALDLQRLRTGRLTRDELQQVAAAVEQIQKRPLFVEANAGITPTELRARARRMKRKHGLGIVAVDYLQLMQAGGSHSNRETEIASISRSLKVLAMELEIPVILISQLNRNVEGRENKRPQLSDLRESGAIEQDADIVLFIYREELYKQVPVESARNAEVIVAKQRMGEFPQTINLLFMGRRQSFGSPARFTEKEAA